MSSRGGVDRLVGGGVVHVGEESAIDGIGEPAF
jgi:hypothetical protein